MHHHRICMQPTHQHQHQHHKAILTAASRPPGPSHAHCLSSNSNNSRGMIATPGSRSSSNGLSPATASVSLSSYNSSSSTRGLQRSTKTCSHTAAAVPTLRAHPGEAGQVQDGRQQRCRGLL